LLRPDTETNNTFWYCLGWAAQKHGIVLHAAVALSNHVHVVATDLRGIYPDFLRDFHGLLARSMNALRGRWEHFWDASQASAVLLEDDSAQLDKLVYVLANPIDLVAQASRWPGATSWHSMLNSAPVVATVPGHFFRDDEKGGEMPRCVAVTFEPPPALAHLRTDEYVRLVRTKVAEQETATAARRHASGSEALGPQRILSQHWNDSPSNAEPRRQLNPTLACRDKWLRIERIKNNKAFHDCYRRAFEAFRKGLAAVFPVGTWIMRFRAPIAFSSP
jgi:hypothetical protein